MSSFAMQFFESAEDFWAWFLDTPLRIILILVIGSILLAVVRRVISHVAERIAAGIPKPSRYGEHAAVPGGSTDPGAAAQVAANPVAASGTLRRGPGAGRPRKGFTPQFMADAFAMANPLTTQRRAQRARTVGSVLRSTANVAIGALMVLMILGELEVNYAPLLASLGVVGIAVGFGAQALVKDVISGLFLLVEDQFGVGDNVDLGGGVVGTVQELGLRLTQVRAFDGTLWYVRNGEIVRAGNRTQEWSRALASVQVPVGSDVDAVRTALGRAADRVRTDPRLAEFLLEAPSVRGIDAVDTAAVTFTLHVQTRPAKQWEIERALRSAAHSELLASGIVASSAVEVPGVQ